MLITKRATSRKANVGMREKEKEREGERENEGVATSQQWQAGTLTRFPTMARARRIVKLVSTVNRSFREATDLEGTSERRTGRRETRYQKRSVNRRSLDHYERRIFRNRVAMIFRRELYSDPLSQTYRAQEGSVIV